jgi:hypothetical protein
MRAPRSVPQLLIALLCFAVSEAQGQTDTTNVAHYALSDESRYETGCFGPCACPVLFSNGLKGTFDLRDVGFDGLYENYEVLNVRWTVPDTTTNLSIQGSGTYRVGGEVAVQQQMKLDLTVGGGTPLRFDSGLVSGGGSFPRITIDISLHQNTACKDTLMHVDASDPITSVDAGGSGYRTRLDQVSSNPFSGNVLFRLTLSRAAPVRLVVYDIQGRVVRNLSRSEWLLAGAHPFTWDGRRDDGKTSTSGVYFVGAQVDGRQVACRVVKIE